MIFLPYGCSFLFFSISAPSLAFLSGRFKIAAGTGRYELTSGQGILE